MVTHKGIWFKLVFCLVALLMVFSVIGCSASSPNVVGKWQAVQGIVSFGLLPFTKVEFLSDHTFILIDFMNVSGKYSFPDGSHIKFDSPGGSLTYGFTMSGDTFTLTGGSNTVKFQRSN